MKRFLVLFLLSVGIRSSAVAMPPDSGVSGQAVLLSQCPPVEVTGTVAGQRLVIRNAKGRQVAQTETDAKGEFQVPLAPGAYRISAAKSGEQCIWEGRNVRVSAHRFSTFRVLCKGVQNQACVHHP